MLAGLPRDEQVTIVAATALGTTALVAFATFAVTSPALAAALGAQVAAHLLVGKETGIPTGLALGTPPVLVAAVAFAQDAFTLLAGYPLASALGRGALRVGKRLGAALKAAPGRGAFAGRTEPVGVALLAGSVWVPFLPTGALAAALLGRAVGYRASRLLPALLVSAFLATAAYTALLVLAFASVPARVALGGLVAVAVLGVLFLRRKATVPGP